MDNDIKILVDTIKEWNLSISDYQINQFIKYYNLLIEWNEKINLTAITEFNEVIIKHFLDSISVVKVCDFSNVTSIIDIGTGAGFPGIPLKILFPDIRIVLLDSLNKRIDFLNLVISELSLSNIETYHGRAEEFARDSLFREKFDLCVSRAVANLSTLSEICIPFVSIDGCFIPYKSSKVDEELEGCVNTFELLDSYVDKIFKFSFFDNERSFVIIKKNNSVSDKYPRRAGIPGKKPLN